MQVMCSKGCGHAITITQEMIEEASRVQGHTSTYSVRKWLRELAQR